MAFGLSPKFDQYYFLDELSPEQSLVIALEAAKKLDWNIGTVSKTGFIAYTNISMSSMGEQVKVNIENKNAYLKSECTGSQMVDWGKNKENINKLVAAITELKSSYTSEELAQKYEELKSGRDSGQEEAISQPLVAKERLSGVLAIFRPAEGYFITPIIINLNIVLFIIMSISGVNILLPDSDSLLRWGANFRPSTLEGEWWRLITNCFLHIGILHLLMNMFALVYIGLLLEPHLGKLRFTVAYLLTGITGSVASLWWHDLTISAGASGAIFGMYGVFLAMLTTNLIEKTARRALLTSIVIFVGYNLVNGLKGGIDNAAHIGGLIGGLVVGYAYYPGLKKPDATNMKFSTIGLLTVIILSASFIVCRTIPNDIAKYDARFPEFGTKEALAMEVFSLPEGTPKEKLLYDIKNRGIYYWNENIKLLNELEQLDLPDIIHDRNKKLLAYCKLRINSFNLIYKTVDEDTEIYKDSLQYYTRQIETIIGELKGN